ncbi:MAG: class I SAM-dependent methyltransferase [Clostridiales bacterium]|nr:class I SAM-dependent methyltransferase [Clostridiales bacterium]
MKELDNSECMLCQSKVFKVVHEGVRDDNKLNVIECLNCGHIQLDRIPCRDDDKEYYDNNKQAEGIEISDSRRSIAKKFCIGNVFNINLLSDNLADTFFKRYDFIYLLHVLEHISNPYIFLKNAKRMLDKNGLIFIEVPNYNDALKSICEEYNHFSYMRAHLSYFKPNVLSHLCESLGFNDVRIKGSHNYSFENAANWIRFGVPEKRFRQLAPPQGLEWLDGYYKMRLNTDLTSDAILAIASNG